MPTINMQAKEKQEAKLSLSRDIIIQWPFDIPHRRFPIGVPLERSLYLQPFSRYWEPLSVFECSGVTWCHRSRTPYAISYWCPLVSISNGFRDIQWRMWRNDWYDL